MPPNLGDRTPQGAHLHGSHQHDHGHLCDRLCDMQHRIRMQAPALAKTHLSKFREVKPDLARSTRPRV